MSRRLSRSPRRRRRAFPAFAVCLIAVCLIASASPIASAQQQYRALPPPGIEIDADLRQTLRDRVASLQKEIEQAAEASGDSAQWRPDVEVFVRAVRLALEQNLFYRPADAETAGELLDRAERRLEKAQRGQRGLTLIGLAPEPRDEPQNLVGGFVSRIDDSVQPYGLVVPAGYEADANASDRHRLDIWLHGRGDRKTEVPFLKERLSRVGQYAPEDTFVLHPFGRHCNAFKFAGETDVYEALAHVRSLVLVDDRRVAIRGFSMGGAGCWHFAAHDPARWFAANPGAGFVDSIVYQGWDQRGMPWEMSPVRRKLLRWYDVLPWTVNLKNTHVVAYSGEVDKQRQAADRVHEASQAQGIEWPYIIGAGMGHKIDAESARAIDETLAQWAAEPARPPRREIDFVTYTLRYADADWLSVTGLKEHWEPGRVRARLSDSEAITVTTDGVTRLRFDFHDSSWPAGAEDRPPDRRRSPEVTIRIDGQQLMAADTSDQPGLQCELVRRRAAWQLEPAGGRGEPAELRKRPGLQGPIDDALTRRFLFVLPSGQSENPAVQKWIAREAEYAQQRWREIMRGQVRAVRDTELTPQQIAENHLVCFGDFRSNRYLAKIADQLPIQWSGGDVQVGERTFAAEHHVPVFCYPNPANPRRYVVINSGLTFREFSNISNSRQIAMLPDWAVLDVRQEDDGIFAGGVASQGFFDERWQLGR